MWMQGLMGWQGVAMGGQDMYICLDMLGTEGVWDKA